MKTGNLKVKHPWFTALISPTTTSTGVATRAGTAPAVEHRKPSRPRAVREGADTRSTKKVSRTVPGQDALVITDRAALVPRSS